MSEKERVPLFGKGDQVEIIGYGSPMWTSKVEWLRMYKSKLVSTEKPKHTIKEDNTFYCYDISPELVGQKATIEKVVITQGTPQYSVTGPNKVAWYNEDQFKLIRAFDPLYEFGKAYFEALLSNENPEVMRYGDELRFGLVFYDKDGNVSSEIIKTINRNEL